MKLNFYDVLSNNETCATIKTQTGYSINLLENGILNRDKYETIRNGKLKHAIFSVSKKEKCVLEICGYRWPPDNYDEDVGSCNWFYKGDTRAPPFPYDENFDLSSMICACKKDQLYTRNCLRQSCPNYNHTWTGSQCAVLFQERNCQQCIFDNIKLYLGSEFASLNSFQIKSLIVRPGCTVFKYTNGALFASPVDPPPYMYGSSNFTNNPVYHKDSENFTCVCEDYVLLDITQEESTTSLVSVIDVNQTLNLLNSDESVSDTKFQTVTLWYFLPALVFVVLILGIIGILVLRYIIKRKKEDKRLRAIDKINGNNMPMEMQEIDNSKENPDSLEKSLKNISSDEITDQMKEQLKKYVESLFESAKNTGQVHNPSINLHQIKESKHFSAIKEQFELICKSQFIVNRDSFKLEEELGRGQFGVVFKGILTNQTDDGLVERVAIKRLKWTGVKERVFDSFLREVRIFQLVGVNHENIVRFVGACCSNEELYILTSLCECGSLESYLKEVVSKRILYNVNSKESVQQTCGYYIVEGNDDEDLSISSKTPGLNSTELHQFLNWSLQIANGMSYMHHKNIIHLDLAVRNILLSVDLVAKIGDLGLSRKCSDGKDFSESLLKGLFPPNSFAPECNIETPNEDLKMSIYVDIWAFGCTIWELFSLGKEPYPNMTFVGVAKFLKQGNRLTQPELAPDFIYEKLLECWREIPHQRPSFTDLIEFFKKKLDESLEK